MYGPYSMAREASGTSWQPDSTPMLGLHRMGERWMTMLDGFANIGYTDQGGRRGNDQMFTTNMLMFMAERPYERGSVGFRSMVTLEPLMGSEGYPELLQTGETADGKFPLIDRQHPHDLFMELAVTGNHEITTNSSVFAYFGLPGEPALGLTTFMHRLSGMDNPEAPIGHHWLDSTHVTYGVATTGVVWKAFKLEGSVFRGREPDQYHWDLEQPKFDSWSTRATVNPTRDWSMQVSFGRLQHPEQLFPTNNTNRATASATYNRAWRDGWWQTTAAWGRNWQQGIDTLDAALLESAVNIQNTHTIFTRYEYVQKDDLLPAIPLNSIIGFGRTEDFHPFFPGGPNPFVISIFGVSRATVGYIHDFPSEGTLQCGLGASGSIILIPESLKPFYGNFPLSFLVFGRVKIGRPNPAQTLMMPKPPV
jgi:hypothetical protein